MKRYSPFIYSVSAFIVSVSLFGCNDEVKPPINSNNNPQPATAIKCPETALTVVIPENASGMGVSAFGTTPLVVPAGGTVKWVNHDTAPHTATSDTGLWETNAIAPGESSQGVQFATVGSYPYHCEYFGKESMSGVVEVVPLPEGCAAPAVAPTVPSGETPAAGNSNPAGN